MDFWINLGIGVAGLIFTLVSFALTWRYTVIARDRDIHAANDDAISAVLKCMALEDYSPTFFDLSAILDGAALKHDVRMSDLLWEEEFIDRIIADALANDLIGPDQRRRITAHLGSIWTPDAVQKARAPNEGKEPYWPVVSVFFGLALISVAFLLAVSGIGAGIALTIDPTINAQRVFGTLLIFGVAPAFAFVCYASYRKFRLIRRHIERRQTVYRKLKSR